MFFVSSKEQTNFSISYSYFRIIVKLLFLIRKWIRIKILKEKLHMSRLLTINSKMLCVVRLIIYLDVVTMSYCLAYQFEIFFNSIISSFSICECVWKVISSTQNYLLYMFRSLIILKYIHDHVPINIIWNKR